MFDLISLYKDLIDFNPLLSILPFLLLLIMLMFMKLVYELSLTAYYYFKKNKGDIKNAIQKRFAI